MNFNFYAMLKKLINKLFKRKNHLQEYQKVVHTYVESLKQAVTSNHSFGAIPLRSIDPNKECIRKWLPTILKTLDLSDNGFVAAMAVRRAVARLTKIKPEEREGYYRMIAGRLYACFSGIPLETAIEEMKRYGDDN